MQTSMSALTCGKVSPTHSHIFRTWCRSMKDDGFAYVSDNALVVDVKEDTDTKEVPPCMLLKSDGASLYTTTDLATIVERMKLLQSGRDYLCSRQASGDALYPGIPLCKKMWSS